MIYIDLKTEDGLAWLSAHKPKPKRKGAQRPPMPREFLEREVAQWMLRDKEVHTGRDLGAKPVSIDFHKITEAGAPHIPGDAAPMQSDRVDRAYVIDEAAKCVSLWRAVVEQQAFDVLKMWGASKEDHRSAVMFFESDADRWRDARDGVCAMAMIEPDALRSAHKAGRIKALADSAIGRERWITRQINAQSTAAQSDLFYSMGIR